MVSSGKRNGVRNPVQIRFPRRQGHIYVDSVNHNLNGSGIRCHIANTLLNNLSYVDDLSLHLLLLF